MSRVTRTFLGIAVPLVSALILAGPASAASAHRPDGWIRVEGDHDCTDYPIQGPWHGQDIYNTTALKQKATFNLGGAFVCNKNYAYFTLNIQNDGTASDQFKVHGTGGTGLKYFHGTTNITSTVVAGTFNTTSLAHGSSYQLQLRIYPQYASKSLVTITSMGDSTKSDAVKALYTNTGCGC